MDPHKPTYRRITFTLRDPLRHFSRDCPGVKLSALLICKLPAIIIAAGCLVAGIGRAKGW